MIKCWKSEQQSEIYISPLGAGDLVDIFNYTGAFQQGYFLTTSELEQFARDAFEAGQDHVYYLHHSGSKSPSFEGFWEQKSLEIENGV